MKIGDMIFKLGVDAAAGVFSLKQFESQAEKTRARVNQNFKSIQKGFKEASASLGGVIAAAGAGFGIKSAVDQFAAADTQIREITTLLDNVTDGSIKRLREETSQTAVSFNQDFASVARARYDIISAGITGIADSAEVLENSAKLAVGGLADISKTADVTTTIMKSFDLAAGDSAHIADTLFKIVRRGKTTISELSEGFGEVAALAPNAGLKLREVAAMTATLTARGFKTNETLTSIQATISAFIKPTTAMQSALKDLGYETGVAAIRAEGFDTILKKVTAGIDETEKGARFENLRALRVVLPIAGNAASAFAEDIEAFKDVAGEADQAFGKMTAGIGFRIGQAQKKLAGALRNIGEAFVPLAEALVGVVGWFSKLSAGAQQLTVFLTAAALAAWKLIPVIKGIDVSFKVLGFTLNSVLGWLGILITVATTLYIVWANNMGGIQDKVFALWEFLKAFARGVFGVFKNLAGRLKDIFFNLGELLAGAFTLDPDRIKTAFDAIQKAIVSDWKKTADNLRAEFKKKPLPSPTAAPGGAGSPAPGAGTAGNGVDGRLPRTEAQLAAEKKLAELRIENIQNEFDRRRAEVEKWFSEEAAKYKNHAAVLAELEKLKGTKLAAVEADRLKASAKAEEEAREKAAALKKAAAEAGIEKQRIELATAEAAALAEIDAKTTQDTAAAEKDRVAIREKYAKARLAMEENLALAELSLQYSGLEKTEAFEAARLAIISKYAAQRAQVEQSAAADISAANRRAVDDAGKFSAASLARVGQAINTSFENLLNQMIDNPARLKFSKIWDDFSLSAIKALYDVLKADIATAIKSLAVHQSTEAAKTATTKAQTAARGQIGLIAIAKEIGLALKSIGVFVAQMAAKLFSWFASLGPVGIALGLASVPALVGTVKGLLKSFQAFREGGVITGPTLGLLAEAGSPEAAIPLNNRGADFIASRLLPRLSAGSAGPAGLDNAALMAKLDTLIKAVEVSQPVINANFDALRFVRELPRLTAIEKNRSF